MELDNFSKHCGSISKSWSFISNTNTLNVTFRSDSYNKNTGFLALWKSTTEPPTYPLTGCNNCDFPFVFGGTFDTCISVKDVDTQPWCLSGPLSPPADEGNHILPPPPKISCSESDSSCPSSPPQTVITSPRYPLNYPDNADQVKCMNRNYKFHIDFFYLCRPGHLYLKRGQGST